MLAKSVQYVYTHVKGDVAGIITIFHQPGIKLKTSGAEDVSGKNVNNVNKLKKVESRRLGDAGVASTTSQNFFERSSVFCCLYVFTS